MDELLKAIRRMNNWARFFNVPFLIDVDRVRSGEEFRWTANPDFENVGNLNAPRFDLRDRLRNRQDFEGLSGVAVKRLGGRIGAPCAAPPVKKAKKQDFAELSNTELLRRFQANFDAENPFYKPRKLSFEPVPIAPAVVAEAPIVLEIKKELYAKHDPY